MEQQEQRVALITGASSGIGAATARRLAAEGIRVVLAARSAERLEALQAEIEAAGGIATHRVTDVTDADDVAELIDFASMTFERIDIVVNNAGLMLHSPWSSVALEDWTKMVDTNVKGYLHTLAAVVPLLIERGSGQIINMGSVASHSVGDSAGVYSATKHFVAAITESLRKELGPKHGIQVTMVSPGTIDTGWADKVNDQQGKEVAAELNAIAIDPEHVGRAVVFAVQQPAEVAINEIIVAPTEQAW